MPTPQPAFASQGAPGRRIAIACPPGEAAREAVSSFVAELGLDAVILRDPPDAAGGGFIEGLDALRSLDYAIVLLSAGEKSAPPLLEIGFLLGAIGRGRMCFLLSGKPALAPELEGILAHTMDEAGLWRLLLAREMKRAGLEVDLNRAM